MPDRWQPAGQDREAVPRLDVPVRPGRVVLVIDEGETHLPVDLERPESQAEAIVEVPIAHDAREAHRQPPGV